MIHNAWHFQFKVGFCVFGGMAKFRVSVAHTLMRRYKHWHSSKNSNVHSLIKLLIGIYAQ